MPAFKSFVATILYWTIYANGPGRVSGAGFQMSDTYDSTGPQTTPQAIRYYSRGGILYEPAVEVVTPSYALNQQRNLQIAPASAPNLAVFGENVNMSIIDPDRCLKLQKFSYACSIPGLGPGKFVPFPCVVEVSFFGPLSVGRPDELLAYEEFYFRPQPNLSANVPVQMAEAYGNFQAANRVHVSARSGPESVVEVLGDLKGVIPSGVSNFLFEQLERLMSDFALTDGPLAVLIDNISYQPTGCAYFGPG